MRRIDLSGPKPRYEAPAVKGLGALDAAAACASGAVATGHCSNGSQNVVGNDCKSGAVNTGTGACNSGTTNTGASGCVPGSTASGGACGSGNYPS